MAPLYHQEALVHVRVSTGRGAAARRDQGHRLSRRELATADRLGCSLRCADRGLDDGWADRFEIDRRGLANGDVAARSARTSYSGLRPLQLHRRRDLHIRCRRCQREVTFEGGGGFLLCLFMAPGGGCRDYDRQTEQKTSTHDFSRGVGQLRRPISDLTSCIPPKSSTVSCSCNDLKLA
jgi:hypothetical protein